MTAFAYLAAAMAEIAGCFAFWAAEGVKPDRWDLTGGAVCLLGAALILWGPRAA